jgi:hypothetical protein
VSAPTRDEIERVVAWLTTDEAAERARRVVEDELVDWRDEMRFVIRRNGLVIHDKDGRPSPIIRFGFEVGWLIALRDALSRMSEGVERAPEDEEGGNG